MTTYLKDPDAVLNYVFDWSDWLDTGETISASVFTVETGLTLDSDSNTNTDATARISGGTAGTSYSVANKITTDGGQIDERTITIEVAQR